MRYDLFIWFIAFVFSICGVIYYPGDGADAIWLNVTLTSSVFMFVFWLWANRRQRRGNWFHPVILFSLSYLIVYFQVPWCVTHDFSITSYYYPFPNMINRTASIAVLGLSAFYLGSSSASHFFYKKMQPSSQSQTIMYSRIGMKKVVNILLIVSSFLFVFFIMLAGKQMYVSFIYDGVLSWGPGATYVNTILFLVTSLLTAVEAVRLSQTKFRSFKDFIFEYDKGVLFFLLVTNLPYLLSGERGTIISFVFAVVAPYFLFSRPLRWRHFVVIIVMSAIILTFMGNMRTRDETVIWKDRLDKGSESVSALSLSPNKWPTIHLAASYRIFNAAVKIVPNYYPYAEGRFIWGNISSLIPFYRRIFPLDPKDYIGSGSLFFTNFLRKGDMSAGEGSAVLGATYLDFGTYGVPVVMFLLGWLLNLVVLKVKQNFTPNAVLWMFLFIYAMFQSVKISRSDPFFWIQNAGWGALLFYFFVKPLMIKMRALKHVKSR